jgi:hypothetical protein
VQRAHCMYSSSEIWARVGKSACVHGIVVSVLESSSCIRFQSALIATGASGKGLH